MTKMTPDQQFMSLAIECSQNGFPAPNPHVGCVVVSASGEVVGQGWHEFAGADHAEVAALKVAGERGQGGTLYVTLEPCNHHGRTPPCVDAVLSAGIKRVVIAVQDPNPMASGGIERLRDAGIEVEVGVLAAEAAKANKQFLFAMRHRRPQVTVKAAVSLDGRIALATGESQWISNEESRALAHRMRAECGCVLVGANTAEIDRARLTVRTMEVRHQPLRVVIDPSRRLDEKLPIFDETAETLRFTNAPVSENDRNFSGGISGLLKSLFAEGQIGVMVEGGAKTTAEFFRADVVDRIVLFIAPIVLGEGPSWTSDFGIETLSGSPRYYRSSVQHCGSDTVLTFERELRDSAARE
jgi:diaminohydroxyphosphoribosylaminopyrimidine deaminase / 5-amino-6-(5-phosphoribosylamino)uracil reductase